MTTLSRPYSLASGLPVDPGAPGDGRRMGHDEYTHYSWAQVVYVRGEDRYKKLFPEAKADEVISWKNHPLMN
jgi:hypothetical protein